MLALANDKGLAVKNATGAAGKSNNDSTYLEVLSADVLICTSSQLSNQGIQTSRPTVNCTGQAVDNAAVNKASVDVCSNAAEYVAVLPDNEAEYMAVLPDNAAEYMAVLPDDNTQNQCSNNSRVSSTSKPDNALDEAIGVASAIAAVSDASVDVYCNDAEYLAILPHDTTQSQSSCKSKLRRSSNSKLDNVVEGVAIGALALDSNTAVRIASKPNIDDTYLSLPSNGAGKLPQKTGQV